MKKIVLKGISQRGKNRIRENGQNWLIVGERDSVAFAVGRGAQWNVRPAMTPEFPGRDRWIAKKNDPDFEIVEIEE